MPYALPILATLIWAGSNVVNRMAVGAIEPAAISFYRWLLAFIVLSPVAPQVWKHRHTVRRHWWKLAVLGVLGMALYQSLAYFAAHSVTATTMGLILGAMPLMVIVLSVLVFRVRPTLIVVTGALISFAGLLYLISAGDPLSLLRHGMGMGELLMLGATLSYAVYNILLKRWAIPLPVWVALYCQIFAGLVVLIVPFLTAPSIRLTAANIPLVAYAGLLSSAAAPGLWNLAVTRLGAERASVFMNLSPLFTALLAVALLGERLHLHHAIGGVMILAGIALAQRKARKKAPAAVSAGA